MKSQTKLKLKSILFDNTRCIGCRSCEEACDNENAARKRKWKEKEDIRKPPEGLSGDKWLHVSHHPLPLKGNTARQPFNWDDAPVLQDDGQYSFMRHACMHCLEPACESACIVGALKKQSNGAVIYDQSKCMGCRYCMLACPFNIPKWEWHKALPYIHKCTMCFDRQKEGKSPACVEDCPGNENGPALLFGTRQELIYEGEKRIHENPDLYHPLLLGRDEMGGTGVLYLLNKNLNANLSPFPDNPGTRSIPNYSGIPQSTVPYWVGGLGGFLMGLNWIISRRNKVSTEENENKNGDEK